MKKTLLTLSMLTALVSANQAFAAFADAPANSAGTGSLTVNGALASTNPNWLWQIPDATAAKGRNIVINKISGVVNGVNTEYPVLKGETLDFLQGYMKTPADRGATGLTPVITIAGTKWNETENSIEHSVTVTTTTGTGEGATTANTGNMKFNIQQGMAFAAFRSGGSFITSPGSTNLGSLSQGTQSILSLQSAFNDTYNVGAPTAWDLNIAGSLQVLAGTHANSSTYTKVSAAHSSKISDIKLVFPSASVPTSWNATIPVTISLK